MRRVVAWLVVLGGVLFAQPLAQAVAVEAAGHAHVYAYDSPHHTERLTHITTERGPPASVRTETIYAGDGQLSLGASARPSVPATPPTYDYDDLTWLVQIARGTGRSEVRAGAEGGLVVVQRSDVAAKSGDEFVDLVSAARRKHILDGEVRPNGTYGGGHRPGTGFPKKSEFPSGWSDDRIIHEFSDVATDPSLVWRAGDRAGDFFVNGTRSGIDIEVLIRNNQIWTGYPTNVTRNAP